MDRIRDRGILGAEAPRAVDILGERAGTLWTS